MSLKAPEDYSERKEENDIRSVWLVKPREGDLDKSSIGLGVQRGQVTQGLQKHYQTWQMLS